MEIAGQVSKKQKCGGRQRRQTRVPRLGERQLAALVAKPDAQQSCCHVIAYSPMDVKEMPCESIADLPTLGNDQEAVWVNINGLSGVELLKEPGETLGQHSL